MSTTNAILLAIAGICLLPFAGTFLYLWVYNTARKLLERK